MTKARIYALVATPVAVIAVAGCGNTLGASKHMTPKEQQAKTAAESIVKGCATPLIAKYGISLLHKSTRQQAERQLGVCVEKGVNANNQLKAEEAKDPAVRTIITQIEGKALGHHL